MAAVLAPPHERGCAEPTPAPSKRRDNTIAPTDGDIPGWLRVLTVGPMAPAVGGMATVAEQLMTGPLSSIVTFHRQSANSNDQGRHSLMRSSWRHLQSVRRLRRALRRERIDIVHIHTCSGFTYFRNLIDAAVARRAGASVCLHIHGGRFAEFCEGSSNVARRVIRQGLTRADCVIVLSEGWRDRLAHYAPSARFAVLPNAVPIPDDPRSAAAATGPCRFVFLGELSRQKGVDTLLAAASDLVHQCVPFHLNLAGPARSDQALVEFRHRVQAMRLNEFVRYAGTVNGSAKEDLLAHCDCLVLPSRVEGMPLAVLEAGARGKAVIATQVGALPEVIDDPKFGLLVPPDNPDHLAQAMEAVATNPARRRSMGSALRERITQRHSLEQQSRLLADLYRDLIARRTVPRDRSPYSGGCER